MQPTSSVLSTMSVCLLVCGCGGASKSSHPAPQAVQVAQAPAKPAVAPNEPANTPEIRKIVYTTQIGLVVEVVIERAFAHPGCFENAIEGSAVEAVRGKLFRGALEQALLAFGVELVEAATHRIDHISIFR